MDVKHFRNKTTAEGERQKIMKTLLSDIAIKEGRTLPPDSDESEANLTDGEEGNGSGPAVPEAAAQIFAKMEAQRLKNRKPGIDKQNRLGETAILRATQNGDEELVQQLIDDGADVNIADHAGWTPLHESSTVSLATLLLDARANPNHPGPKDGHDAGNTPLHEAARHGNATVIKVMLMRNANSRLQNSANQAAAELADDPAVAKLLREHNPEEMPLYIPMPQEKQKPETTSPPRKTSQPKARMINNLTPDDGGGRSGSSGVGAGTSTSGGSKRRVSSSSKPVGRPSSMPSRARSTVSVGHGGAHNSGGGSRRIVLKSAQDPDAEEIFFTTATAACNFLKSGKSQFYGAMRSRKAYKGWYVVDEGKKDGSGIPVTRDKPKSGKGRPPLAGELEIEVDVFGECDGMMVGMEVDEDDDEHEES